jgi:hypothetical protein
VTRLLIGATLLAMIAYGLWEVYPLVAGPALTITSPKDGATYKDGVVIIEGSAARATALALNGSPLLPERSGHYSLTLAFPRGGSILRLTATDRFGRTVTKERIIYVP